jgi:putative nucleotide binding protein
VSGLYREQKKYEEYAYVLDYLPHGRPGAPRTPHTSSGVIQMVGESYFTLLEASPKKDADYNPRDRIFVGKGDRALVSHIIGRITYLELTSSAKAELLSVIEIVVRANEAFFVNFFNTSQPVTPRMHSLELIPGIGKRLMFQILDIRERAPFNSFQDIEDRVNLKDIAGLLAKRVLEELSQEEKYLLFTRPSADHVYQQ